MIDKNDMVCMLDLEDNLDGTNYALWLDMMYHILVAKGVWNIIASIDEHHGSCVKNANNALDEAIISTTHVVVVEPPTQEHTLWDGRDASIHTLIVFFMKNSIIPYICKGSMGYSYRLIPWS